MNTIKNIKTLYVLGIMLILMILTRGHSYWLSSLVHLPDFTIPALFIAGIYFRDWRVAVVLIISAVAIDNYVIVYKGVSANCITPAYSVLPLLYFGVFLSGKFINSLSVNNLNSLMKISGFVLSVTVLEWLFATTSYYAFTSSDWSKFPSYAMHWAPAEILAVLQWMIVVVSVFSLNYRFAFFPYFQAKKN
jgi:hypothetical protein